MSRSILSLYFLFRSWKRSEEICVTLLFWTAFKDGHSHRITENKWQNRRENRPFELYANSKSTQSSAEAAVKSCTLNQIFNDDNLVDVQKYRAISTFLIAFFFLPVESEEKRQVEQSFASTLRARRTVGGCGSRANYARGRTPWSSSWLPVHSAESVCDVAPFYFFIIMFYKSTYIRKTWVLVAVERQHFARTDNDDCIRRHRISVVVMALWSLSAVRDNEFDFIIFVSFFIFFKFPSHTLKMWVV